ncbi:MAG: C1 family peptidase [Clostridium sp.]|nr:C1 family peptidase [Clostridium sp.]
MKKKIISAFIMSLILISNINVKVFADDVISRQYDPREEGLVTSVKDQGYLDTCFAFSATATIESYMLLKGYGNYDYSEEHIRWWAMPNKDGYGWQRKEYEGCPVIAIPGYLTSGSGPVNEDDLPYVNSKYNLKADNYDKIGKTMYVTDIAFIPEDDNKVKEAIRKYGAVSSSYYSSLTYLNGETRAYYCPQGNNYATNHNVTIVGWDDDYSKENFKEYYRPDNDGAWLVKNSWGANDTNGGYLWISYEDAYILNTTKNKVNYAIKRVEPLDENLKVYQYDEYGATTSLYLKDNNGNQFQKMIYANVYDFSDEYNVLDKIEFMVKDANYNYKLYYSKVDSQGKPILDEKSMVELYSGVIDEAGYITVDIENFKLPKGKGVVAIILDGTQSNIGAGLGCETNLKYNGNELIYKAQANIGESFIYVDGELIDLNESFTDSNRSLSLKAITRKSSDTSCLLSFNDNKYDFNEEGISNIDLPYHMLNEEVNLEVAPTDSYSKILFDGEEKSKLTKKIMLDSTNKKLVFECLAADGNKKKYYVNISISKEIKSSNDFEKFVLGIQAWDDDSILKANKYYEDLDENEKIKIDNNILNKVIQKREELASKYSACENIRVEGIPWNVKVSIKRSDSGNDIMENYNTLSEYEVELVDMYTSKKFISESNINIIIKEDSKLLDKLSNIINIDKNNKISSLKFNIENDNIIIKEKNINKLVLLEEKSLKDVENNDDNEKVNGKDDVNTGEKSYLIYLEGSVLSSIIIFLILKNSIKR